MEEHGRQSQNRDDVRPVEHPVEPVEPPAEREGEHAEERDGEPEEVQRCRIARAPQSDRSAHEQREDPDGRQHEIECAATRRHWSHTDIDDFARAESERRVAKGPTAPGRVQDRDEHRRPPVRDDRRSRAADPRGGARRPRPACRARPRPRQCPRPAPSRAHRLRPRARSPAQRCSPRQGRGVPIPRRAAEPAVTTGSRGPATVRESND